MTKILAKEEAKIANDKYFSVRITVKLNFFRQMICDNFQMPIGSKNCRTCKHGDRSSLGVEYPLFKY